MQRMSSSDGRAAVCMTHSTRRGASTSCSLGCVDVLDKMDADPVTKCVKGRIICMHRDDVEKYNLGWALSLEPYNATP